MLYEVITTKKHYDKILKRYDVSEDELKDGLNEILKYLAKHELLDHT